MSFTEKNFQSLFTAWLRNEHKAGRQMESAGYELKLSKTNRLAFSSFQSQQIPKLLQAKHGCIAKKLSDADRSMKPFDMISVCKSGGYVAVMFYKPRKPKEFTMIDIDTLMLWRKINNEPKSITEDEAKEIGFIYQLT